ncbi:MAG: ribonuclease [Peptococcaceae bacterium]|nr:ribonuclease [Peptococcaceae bacterium]
MKTIWENKYFRLFAVLLLSIGLLCGCGADDVAIIDTERTTLAEDGSYTSPDDVAEYLHFYGHLPDNFITKNEARNLGWDSQVGNLDEVAPGMSIGGDTFGNREGLLPKADGRKYYECDVNYEGGYRGEERIVYSSDGLIFYTDDHYESFEQLY